MTPNERRQRIRHLLQKHRSLRISDLSEWLQVSEMTIYRDLKPLIQEGVANKTYGGVEWVSSVKNPPSGCVLCGRAIDQRLAYRLILKDRRVETACCPHCGLLLQHQMQEQLAQGLCQDFITNTTISADTAWYVFHSQADIRCCQPQILTFQHKETAERFIKGFDGILYSFDEALTQLQHRMNQGSSCGCHPHNTEGSSW